MKYTLLELTQDVLSAMDSDEINSIGDTAESQQVVKIIKAVYDDILSRGDLITNKVLFNLTSSGDNLKPVLMYKPNAIDRIEWIRYNTVLEGDTDPAWRDLCYLQPMDFIRFIDGYNPSEDNVDTMTVIVDGFSNTFSFRNDAAPQYFTSFNDNMIIFDAYDGEVDTTLQENKTRCYGSLATVFTEADTFEFDLQPQQHALLFNEAKSLAWSELKLQQHPKAEQSARRNWRHLQKTRRQVPDTKVINNRSSDFAELPNFSRR